MPPKIPAESVQQNACQNLVTNIQAKGKMGITSILMNCTLADPTGLKAVPPAVGSAGLPTVVTILAIPTMEAVNFRLETIYTLKNGPAILEIPDCHHQAERQENRVIPHILYYAPQGERSGCLHTGNCPLGSRKWLKLKVDTIPKANARLNAIWYPSGMEMRVINSPTSRTTSIPAMPMTKLRDPKNVRDLPLEQRQQLRTSRPGKPGSRTNPVSPRARLPPKRSPRLWTNHGSKASPSTANRAPPPPNANVNSLR